MFYFDVPGTKCFHSFNTRHHLRVKVIVLTSFICITRIILIFQEGNWSSEGLSNLPPVHVVGSVAVFAEIGA